MRRVAITLALGLLCCLVAVMAQAQAPAHDQGIVRIDRLPTEAAATAGSRLDAIAGTASVRNDRLEGAVHGSGWWRLQPQAATGRRLLLVFHPYSARLTVRLPPDYRVQRQSVFDRDLDARYSRRALVFPFAGNGPIYVGIEGARYPLQVAVRDIGSHAA